MTRLLFLLNDDDVLLLSSPLPADQLVEAIRAGEWRPSPPCDHLLPVTHPGEPPRLRAFRRGSLVIVTTQPGGMKKFHRPVSGKTSLHLSPRQRQIIQLLSEGLTIKEIAARLKLHPRTVSLHIAEIKSRLGGSTLSQSVGRATLLGLCRPKK